MYENKQNKKEENKTIGKYSFRSSKPIPRLLTRNVCLISVALFYDCSGKFVMKILPKQNLITLRPVAHLNNPINPCTQTKRLHFIIVI